MIKSPNAFYFASKVEMCRNYVYFWYLCGHSTTERPKCPRFPYCPLQPNKTQALDGPCPDCAREGVKPLPKLLLLKRRMIVALVMDLEDHEREQSVEHQRRINFESLPFFKEDIEEPELSDPVSIQSQVSNVLFLQQLPFNKRIIPKPRQDPVAMGAQLSNLFFLEDMPFHKKRIPQDRNKHEDVVRLCGHTFDALTDRVCSVCYNDFDECCYPLKLPCSHVFCVKCLGKWFEDHGDGHDSCPVCRRKYTLKQRERWFPQNVTRQEDSQIDFHDWIAEIWFEVARTILNDEGGEGIEDGSSIVISSRSSTSYHSH
jgi:hypothetical protein